MIFETSRTLIILDAVDSFPPTHAKIPECAP